MNVGFICYLLFIHWIADFVCQSDKVAKGKSTNNSILGEHCVIYCAVFSVLTWNPIFGILLGLIHFPVDYVTSRLNSYLWKKGDVHNFFVSVGFDQFIHFVTILYVWQLLGAAHVQ